MRSRSLLALDILLFAAICGSLLYWYPPIWPDEVSFVQPALSLLREGHFGTPLYGELIPGMDRHTYWQPPAYGLLLAAVVELAGFGLVQLRLASVLFGCAGLALAAALAWRLSGSHRAGLLAAFLLSLEPLWIRGSNMARMDVMTVVLTLGALAAYVEASRRERTTRWLSASGLLSALAVMTHPLGALAYGIIGLHCLLWERRLLRPSAIAAFVAPGLVLGAAWGLYILQDPAAFAAQMKGQLARKGAIPLSDRALQLIAQYGVGRDAHHVAAAHGRAERYPLVVALHGVALGVGAWTLLRVRSSAIGLTSIAAAVSLAGAVVGGEGWYPPYYIPHLCVLAAVVAARPPRRSVGFAIVGLGALAAIATSINLARVGWMHWRSLREETSYARFSEELFRDIPDGARVYVACLPDPYFHIAGKRKLDLVQIIPPSFATDPEAFRRMVASRDYLVISYRWFSDTLLTVGDPILEEAIARGEKRVVGKPGGAGYAALVVKLR